MAKKNIQAHEWIKLAESFQKIGRGLIGEGWLDDCWKVGFFPPDQLPHYFDESKIDFEAFEDENPDIWDDVEFASQDMILQFERAQEYLLKCLWHGDLGVSFIDPSGRLEELETHVWRDYRYTVSWSESILIRWTDNSGPTKHIWFLEPKMLHDSIVKEATWNIEVRLSDVKKLLKSLDNERRYAVRKGASKKNPNKGGRPSTYDWEKIGRYIRETLKNSDKATSDSLVAAEVGKRLEGEGIDPPVSSALRKAVKQAREA